MAARDKPDPPPPHTSPVLVDEPEDQPESFIKVAITGTKERKPDKPIFDMPIDRVI